MKLKSIVLPLNQMSRSGEKHAQCTELKYDLPHFYGPQSHILSGDTFEGPCSKSVMINDSHGAKKICILVIGDHPGFDFD